MPDALFVPPYPVGSGSFDEQAPAMRVGATVIPKEELRQFTPQPMPSWMVQPTPPPSMSSDESMRRIEDISQEISRLPANQAMQAMQMAIQLEGMLGFEADRKAGIPMQDAMAKWAPKIYFRNPASMPGAIKAFAPPPTPRAVNIPGIKTPAIMFGNQLRFPPAAESREMFTPPERGRTAYDERGKEIGTFVQRTPNAWTFVPSRLPEEQREELKSLNVQEKAAQTRLTKAQENLGFLDPSRKPTQYAALSNDVATATQELARIQASKRALFGRSDARTETEPMVRNLDKQAARREALDLIKRYPSKAKAIQSRYRQVFEEDL